MILAAVSGIKNSVISYFLNLYESRLSLLLRVHIFSIICENWYFYSIYTSDFRITELYGKQAIFASTDICQTLQL